MIINGRAIDLLVHDLLILLSKLGFLVIKDYIGNL